MTGTQIITGQVLSFVASPFETPPDDAVQINEAVLIKGGHVTAVGDLRALRHQVPDAPVDHRPDQVISAGFVDAHVHYPQTAIIASWGKRLKAWLKTYTFPEEIKFKNPAYAAEIAGRYLDLALSCGTTTMASYCTSHPASVEAFFAAAQARGLRAVAGKTCMDCNAPAALCDTVQSGYDDSAKLIAKWAGRGRLSYAITPRFAPTSTEEQLAAAGALWAENPECAMQTHLSEQTEEIAWMKELFPSDEDYLSVYQRHDLCGPGALMGHAIHLTDRERAALRDTGAAVAHCPTSNAFIGSGLCDVTGLKSQMVSVGLATDVGGGSSFSMLATMKSAYEIGQLRGNAMSPAQLWWLATKGSADALRISGHVGTLAPGMEADIVALDPVATPVLAQRTARAESIEDILFALLILGDDRAIAETWVSGTPQKALK